MEENNDRVIEEVTETTEETPKQEEKQPKGNETKGDVTKVKTKMQQPVEDLSKETITKVDLGKKSKENVQSTDTDEKSDVQKEVAKEEIVEEKPVEEVAEKTTETPILEEIAPAQEDEKNIETDGVEEINESVKEPIEQPVLPENIQSLVNFMEETGGDIKDYVNLNQSYEELDNIALLEEYYKQTKPHLDKDEINFIMEDSFSYNEEVDYERDIQRKKLALKEQVASARDYLDGLKSKYYKDLKSGKKLTKEQQEAIEFFDNYKRESEQNEKANKLAKSDFMNKTNKVFNDKFKGFEYNVGDKNYRFNVSDVNEVKNTQSDIDNFIGKFLNKDRQMEDAEGYHKSLFTAMNADAIAKHFYEQGKADAIKTSIAQSKNVDMEPRTPHGEIEAGGIKVKVLGDDSSSYKLKFKNKR